MLSSICLSLLALISTANATPLSTSPHIAPNQRSPFVKAPLLHPEHPHGTLNNSFIVMLKQDLSPELKANHFNFLQAAHNSDPLLDPGSGVQRIYEHINGYSGRFTENVVDHIRSMPEVDFVERDQIVRTMDVDVQKSAPWGLARISHRDKLTWATFTKYIYDGHGGEGVDVYVVDTGINIEHVEFQGRASWGTTIPDDVDEDGNGHGTHCAGTIASHKYGVAKGANVVAVKVLGSNGSGSMSDVVGGVDWAATQAKAKAAAARAEYAATGKTKHKGSVANMSLGGGKSESLDRAVDAAVDSGLHFAVAAGNDNRDACSYSPAASKKAVTVGASTITDERAYFSNHGECVDVFAPGLNIVSTYKGSTTAIATLSGTSMASPHTAGILAYLLSIYPSKSFDPLLNNDDFLPRALESQQAFTASYLSSIYRLACASLPTFIAEFLPTPGLLQTITGEPDELPTLSPVQLKKALLRLSTEGLISDLPSKTPNLLIFNNATTA